MIKHLHLHMKETRNLLQLLKSEKVRLIDQRCYRPHSLFFKEHDVKFLRLLLVFMSILLFFPSDFSRAQSGGAVDTETEEDVTTSD